MLNNCICIITSLFLFVVALIAAVKFFKNDKHKFAYAFMVIAAIGLILFKFSPDIQKYGAKFGKNGFIGLERGLFSDKTETIIKNTSETKEEKQKVVYFSKSNIEQITFTEGDQYLKQIGGGEGNTYVIYEIDLPPGKAIKGSVVTPNTVIVVPIGDN